MRVAKWLLTVGVACLSLIVIAGVAGRSAPVSASPPGSADAQVAERAARHSEVSGQLVAIQAKAPFRARLPRTVPVGFTYDRVNWEPPRPQRGFGLWLAGSQRDGRGIHIIEAPAVAGAPKDTLRLSGLTPVVLSNGVWQTLQKPNEPWQGLWIFATIMDGVHIEVDGFDKNTVAAVASSL